MKTQSKWSIWISHLAVCVISNPYSKTTVT
ncbi:Uncharacterised protein [Vibrio cholerae]|nr:Uncharacterised protein [Vibrio cholerae]